MGDTGAPRSKPTDEADDHGAGEEAPPGGGAEPPIGMVTERPGQSRPPDHWVDYIRSRAPHVLGPDGSLIGETGGAPAPVPGRPAPRARPLSAARDAVSPGLTDRAGTEHERERTPGAAHDRRRKADRDQVPSARVGPPRLPRRDDEVEVGGPSRRPVVIDGDEGAPPSTEATPAMVTRGDVTVEPEGRSETHVPPSPAPAVAPSEPPVAPHDGPGLPPRTGDARADGYASQEGRFGSPDDPGGRGGPPSGWQGAGRSDLEPQRRAVEPSERPGEAPSWPSLLDPIPDTAYDRAELERWLARRSRLGREQRGV
jgi:hypothetical protein